ncbi:hypothetical protein [Saccharopolyspora taberi]|uniref:Uncharacterized protein n=1 Tax=Saccharopolyspora taberi TaxID=60895 RepID=A0ABN3V884_9PSEU
MSTPQGLGPDFFRQVVPPEIRERLGLMNAWALRMALAYMGGQADTLADYAGRISTYDDTVADSPYAGKFPGTCFSFPVKRAIDLISMMLEAAERHRTVRLDNADVVAGVRQLVTDLVPAEDQDAALAVVDQQPTTGAFGGWRLEESTAGIGELYVVTALAAWLAGNREISPSREAARRVVMQQVHDFEATARGVPEAERLDVTEQEALDLLDAVLGTTSPDLSAFGIAPGQSAITRDRSKRTLVEMEVVEAAKAHLIEHPIRTDETDRILLEAIGRAMDSSEAPSDRGDGMTETERRRAEKLAARKARRDTGGRTGGGKRKRR